MAQFIRNFILVSLGLMLFVGLITAGFFIGLAALAAGLVFWVYLKLRMKGIIKEMNPTGMHHPSSDQPSAPQQIEIIDAEYTVIDEKEERERQDKV